MATKKKPPTEKAKKPPVGRAAKGLVLGRGSGGAGGHGFKPGQSGFAGRRHITGPYATRHNRPLNGELSSMFDEVNEKDPAGRTWGRLFTEALIMQAMSGNAAAINQVCDRLGGKIAITIAPPDPNGAGGISHDLTRATDAELAALESILEKTTIDITPKED